MTAEAIMIADRIGCMDRCIDGSCAFTGHIIPGGAA